MKDEQDAFGHAVYDFHHGRKIVEIIEREDGLLDTTAGPAAYFAPFEEWMLHEQKAMAFVRGRVLDVGCGAGRHSLHLQEQGFDVTGIDISPLAIEVCRLRGLKDARAMGITRVSSRLGNYDTVLLLGNNFGLLANPRRARWLLRRFHRMTPENGRIVTTSNDIYQTTDPRHLAYQEQNRQRGRMSGQIRIRVRYRHFKDPWFDYLMVSKEEMQQLLEGSGWQVRTFIESDGPAYAAIIEKSGG
jgi:SAM-dependent methyltransferase